MEGVSRSAGYVPGIDGLRAIAVVAVVLFHLEIEPVRGGFLGVSLFFTLSGYLITTLLLEQHQRTGRVSLSQFWGRRVRRLVPAAMTCLALVVLGSMVLAATGRASTGLASAGDIDQTRRDVAGAALNVANWKLLIGGQSYAQLFSGHQSPVLHFWSLAIEEQFYFVFPIVVVGLLALRRRWMLPAGLAALAVASVGASLTSSDHDVIYYGTHTRAAELLVGALLACALRSRAASVLMSNRTRVVQVTGFVGLAGAVYAVVNTRQGDGWLYRGGFPAMAIVWCLLIVAAIAPGAFGAGVSWRPLAAIGRRSYGLYLFHWPVFVLLSAEVLHTSGWATRGMQLAVVVVLTECCYRWVEQPVRARLVLSSPRSMRLSALGAIVAVLAAVTVVPAPAAPAGVSTAMIEAPDEPVRFPVAAGVSTVGAGARADDSTGTSAAPTPEEPPSVASAIQTSPLVPAPVVPAPVVTVMGSESSVVAAIDPRAVEPGADDPRIHIVDDVMPGCPLVRPDGSSTIDPSCSGRFLTVEPAPASGGDVVVIAIGAAEHDAFTMEMADYSNHTVPEQLRKAQDLRQRAVAEFERLGSLARTVIVVDAVDVADLLSESLTEAAISTPSLRRIPLSDVQSAVERTVFGTMSTASGDTQPPMRVLVIGDSTSYGVAVSLSRQPGGEFDVLWAGQRNCPLIAVERIRWLKGDEFATTSCPRATPQWNDAARELRPDVILAVDGMPEEVAQQYAGDDAWRAPGDAAYVAAHDAGITDVMNVAASVGAVVLVADAPAGVPGGDQWARPAGIEAWNAQVRRWDARWAPLEIVPYRSMIESAEAFAGHDLRPDGLHVDEAVIDSVVGAPLAIVLRTRVPALQSGLAASACRVPSNAGFILELPRCH